MFFKVFAKSSRPFPPAMSPGSTALIRTAARWTRWQLAVLGKNRGKHGGFLSRHCPLPGRKQPNIGAVERVSRQAFGRTERERWHTADASGHRHAS
jgi:hypothetical protein